MKSKKNYRPYLKARDFVRSLGLKNHKDWTIYYNKELNIPSHPERYYKNFGWTTWMDWLGTNNGEIWPRRHIINDKFFKKWSNNMSYIFGFWFADGYIGKGKIFSISQNKKDAYILEMILKEMNSNYSIRHYRDRCCRFTIYSKEIYEDITNLGGKEKKSLNCKFPNIPNKYLPDFIRGLWDGDGCIHYRKKQMVYNSSYVSGSKLFIKKMYSVLKKNIPYLGGSLSQHKSSGTWVLCFAKNDTIRLKQFMYSNRMDGKLFLKRKYKMFQDAVDKELKKH